MFHQGLSSIFQSNISDKRKKSYKTMFQLIYDLEPSLTMLITFYKKCEIIRFSQCFDVFIIFFARYLGFALTAFPFLWASNHFTLEIFVTKNFNFLLLIWLKISNGSCNFLLRRSYPFFIWFSENKRTE